MRIRVKKAGTSDVPVLVLVPADSTIKSLIRSCAEKLNIDRHSASLTLMCCGGAICDIQDLVDLDECEISVAPLPSAHLEAPRTPSPEVTRSKNILEDVEPDLDQRRSQIKKRKRSLSIEKSTPPPKKAHVPVGAAKKTSNTEPAKPPKSSVSPLVRAVSLFPHLISNLIRHSKYVQKLHGWNFDEVKQINQISDLNLRSSVIMRYLEARGWFIIPPRNEELMRMGYISFILDTLQVDRNPATETNTVSRASGAVEHRWTVRIISQTLWYTFLHGLNWFPSVYQTASGRVDLLRMLAQAKFLSKPIRKAFNSSSAAYGSFLPEWVTSKHTEKLLDNKPVLEPLEVSIDKLISQSGQSIGEDLLLASFSKYHTRSTHKVVPVDETAMMALANEELEAQRTAEIMRTLFGDDKDQFINNHQHDSITSDVLSDSRESTASTEHQHSVVSEKSAKPRPSFAPVKPEILPRNDVVPTIPLPSVVSVRPANPPSNIPQPKVRTCFPRSSIVPTFTDTIFDFPAAS